MKPHEEFDEDFGISGLTKYVGFRFAPTDEADCLDLTARLLEQKGPAYAQTVLDDSQSLRRSSLSDEVLSALWLAAARARFDPAGAGLDARAWLDRIADTCVTFIGQETPSAVPVTSFGDPDREVRAAVLAELAGVGSALSEAAVTSLYVPALPSLVSALEAAVVELAPDLGFRLFLRAMKAYFVPIGPGRLARFEEIGRKLGYHEFVVEDGNLNIWSDLVD